MALAYKTIEHAITDVHMDMRMEQENCERAYYPKYMNAVQLWYFFAHLNY